MTDDPAADADMEADVIMTAATIGFALSAVIGDEHALRLDMDPADRTSPTKRELHSRVVSKLDCGRP